MKYMESVCLCVFEEGEGRGCLNNSKYMQASRKVVKEYKKKVTVVNLIKLNKNK